MKVPNLFKRVSDFIVVLVLIFLHVVTPNMASRASYRFSSPNYRNPVSISMNLSESPPTISTSALHKRSCLIFWCFLSCFQGSSTQENWLTWIFQILLTFPRLLTTQSLLLWRCQNHSNGWVISMLACIFDDASFRRMDVHEVLWIWKL